MLPERDKSQLLMVDVQERLLPAMSDPTLRRMQDAGVRLKAISRLIL